MIAHVAEVGEARGRVVLRICDARPSEVALGAAVRVAQAYQSEVESLFVRDAQLGDLANYSFARIITPSGRLAQRCDLRELQVAYRAIERTVSRQLAALAAGQDVPFRARMVEGEPLQALIMACAERGPWNVIALAEPVGGYAFAQIEAVFANIRDVTGLVLAGRQARRLDGPVAVVVDDVALVHGALRTAARLAETADVAIVVLAAGIDDAATAAIEGDLRLLFADSPPDARVALGVAPSLHGDPAAMAEWVRRQQPGFVVARFGGAMLADAHALKAAIAALECPVFLLR